MAKNASILAAFERMWFHVITAINNKSDIFHDHDDIYYTQTQVDTKLSNKSDSSHTHDEFIDLSNYTATIATTWSGSEAPYSQAITITGIIADDRPIVDVTMSGTFTTDQTRLAEWAKIYRIVTAADKITVYATEKTTVPLPIQLQVVR